MIAYLDTSSLVKLYVEEDGSQEMRDLRDSADALATCAAAYPEDRAAFARLARERRLRPGDARRVRGALEADWDHYVVVQVMEALCRRAGDLADRRALRGFDAIHLASYLALAESAEAPVVFSSFDRAQVRAATLERRRSSRRRP